MGVFQFFKIAQMLANRAKRLISSINAPYMTFFLKVFPYLKVEGSQETKSYKFTIHLQQFLLSL